MAGIHVDPYFANAVSPAAIAQGKRMKLLLISPSFVGYGGIEAFVLHLASFLKQQSRIELRVCLKVAGECGQAASLHDAIAKHDVPVTWVDRGSRELLREIAWADLLHVQNAPPDVLFPALLMGKPFVLTIHNQLRGPGSLHRTLWRLGARFAKRRWFNSSFVRSTWGDKTGEPLTRCIPTICNLPRGEVAPELRRGFVFISRMVEGKGVETLAEAYRLADLDPRQWPLHLIGDGPVKSKIERLSLPGVHVHGFVSESEKGKCLQNARWLVAVPDTPEDMGLTPLEARAVGVPCIVSEEGGLPEVAGEGSFLCRPRSPESLADAFRNVAAMSEAAYTNRVESTKAGLSRLIVPLQFYLAEYEAILSKAS